MMRITGLILCIMLLSGSGFAQSNLSAAVDKNRIFIGEQVQLYLKAVVNKKSPAWFSLDTIPHFEILKRSPIDTTQTGKGLFLQQTITVTSFDSGRWTIPSFRLNGGSTQPMVVEVTFSPMDPNQPYHDIKDILPVQRPESSNWYWYLLGIAVLVALFMLFFPPTEKKTEVKPVVEEDVYGLSMKRLEKLRASDEHRTLYTELTDIFRNYLAKRRNIQSFSQTTDDLAVQLKDLSLPGEQYTQLVQVLRQSDMVKFARYLPTVVENENAIMVIRNNINSIEKKG